MQFRSVRRSSRCHQIIMRTDGNSRQQHRCQLAPGKVDIQHLALAPVKAELEEDKQRIVLYIEMTLALPASTAVHT